MTLQSDDGGGEGEGGGHGSSTKDKAQQQPGAAVESSGRSGQVSPSTAILPPPTPEAAAAEPRQPCVAGAQSKYRLQSQQFLLTPRQQLQKDVTSVATGRKGAEGEILGRAAGGAAKRRSAASSGIITALKNCPAGIVANGTDSQPSPGHPGASMPLAAGDSDGGDGDGDGSKEECQANGSRRLIKSSEAASNAAVSGQRETKTFPFPCATVKAQTANYRGGNYGGSAEPRAVAASSHPNTAPKRSPPPPPPPTTGTSLTSTAAADDLEERPASAPLGPHQAAAVTTPAADAPNSNAVPRSLSPSPPTATTITRSKSGGGGGGGGIGRQRRYNASATTATAPIATRSVAAAAAAAAAAVATASVVGSPTCDTASSSQKHRQILCHFLGSADIRWLSDVEIICSDGSLRSHRLVLAAASPNFLKNLFEDVDCASDMATLVCPDVTISEMARVLCLVYRGEAILESSVDAAKYHNCLKLITCLGIPIEDFVVGTRNSPGAGRPDPTEQHQEIIRRHLGHLKHPSTSEAPTAPVTSVVTATARKRRRRKSSSHQGNGSSSSGNGESDGDIDLSGGGGGGGGGGGTKLAKRLSPSEQHTTSSIRQMSFSTTPSPSTSSSPGVLQHADSTVGVAADEAAATTNLEVKREKAEEKEAPAAIGAAKQNMQLTCKQEPEPSSCKFFIKEESELMPKASEGPISPRPLPFPCTAGLMPLPRHELVDEKNEGKGVSPLVGFTDQKPKPGQQQPAAVIILRYKTAAGSCGDTNDSSSCSGSALSPPSSSSPFGASNKPQEDVGDQAMVGLSNDLTGENRLAIKRCSLSDEGDGGLIENGFTNFDESADMMCDASDDEDEDNEDEEDAEDILYKCDLCGQRFHLLDFLKHQDVHKDDSPYQCPNPTCGRKFKTQSEFRAHRRMSHKSNGTLAATSAIGYGVAAQGRKEQHEACKSRFVCPHCKKGFNFLANLRSHLSREHPQKQHQQHETPKESPTVDHLTSGSLAVSNPPSSLPATPTGIVPSSVGVTASSLVGMDDGRGSGGSSSGSPSGAHQPPSLLPRSVASKGIFTCKLCGTAHVSWDEFSRHFLLAHGSVPRILLKYKCVPCNASFAFRSEYLKHNAEKKHGAVLETPPIITTTTGSAGTSPKSAVVTPVLPTSPLPAEQTITPPSMSAVARPTIVANGLSTTSAASASASTSPSATSIRIVLTTSAPTTAPTNSPAAVATPSSASPSFAPSLSLQPSNFQTKAVPPPTSLPPPPPPPSAAVTPKVHIRLPQTPVSPPAHQDSKRIIPRRELTGLARATAKPFKSTSILSPSSTTSTVTKSQHQGKKIVGGGSGGGVIKQCEICGTQFRSAKSYKRHMDQCHVANGPRHVCCLCQRVFKRSDNLSAHYRSVHFGVKPNKCSNCGKGYRTKNELYRHAENCSAKPTPALATAQITSAAAVTAQLPPLPQIPEPPSSCIQPSAPAVAVSPMPALPQRPILPMAPVAVSALLNPATPPIGTGPPPTLSLDHVVEDMNDDGLSGNGNAASTSSTSSTETHLSKGLHDVVIPGCGGGDAGDGSGSGGGGVSSNDDDDDDRGVVDDLGLGGLQSTSNSVLQLHHFDDFDYDAESSRLINTF